MKTSLRELEPALEHFPIAASEAREVRGGFNQHFRLTTRDGEKHLIIFRPQPGMPPRDLQFEMSRHVVHEGFQLVAEPVPTTSGRPFAKTRLGTAALVDWVPGDAGSAEPEWSGELLSSAGQVLAALHQAVRHFRPERSGRGTLGPLYLPADEWVERREELLADLRDHHRSLDDAAAIAETAERLDHAGNRFDPTAYREAIASGTGVVHGDYRPGNLIVDQGRIVAVVDFDAAFWESRVYDLAYAAFQFAGDECVYPQQRREPGVEFVRSYTQSWPLSEAEQRLFPFFLRQVVLKRLLSGRDIEPRLRLLDQLDDGLEDELVRAAA